MEQPTIETGSADVAAEFLDFVPGFPETPVNIVARQRRARPGQLGDAALGRRVSGRTSYDIYFGTTQHAAARRPGLRAGLGDRGRQSIKESYTFTDLQPGVTYYWRIVGKTMADRAVNGPTWQLHDVGRRRHSRRRRRR